MIADFATLRQREQAGDGITSLRFERVRLLRVVKYHIHAYMSSMMAHEVPVRKHEAHKRGVGTGTWQEAQERLQRELSQLEGEKQRVRHELESRLSQLSEQMQGV